MRVEAFFHPIEVTLPRAFLAIRRDKSQCGAFGPRRGALYWRQAEQAPTISTERSAHPTIDDVRRTLPATCGAPCLVREAGEAVAGLRRSYVIRDMQLPPR